jgi:hypothetical protein
MLYWKNSEIRNNVVNPNRDSNHEIKITSVDVYLARFGNYYGPSEIPSLLISEVP